PLRSVGTFIELLIGAMLTPAGFVTEAYLVVTMRNHWSSYYCRVPCDYIPKRSYPLFRTRQILNDWLTQNLEGNYSPLSA
ncbi:hypothetical protein, partial [Thiolapillus sp.]|uniref:hypothetical protein n=1 Tax=Thiolapillus sp. TaxID=2017437 RepID=UPI003AF9BB68